MDEPNEAELRAKIREFFELLLGSHEPRDKALAIAAVAKEGRSRIERQMRAFHAVHGRLPVIQPDPSGSGLSMEALEEAEQADVSAYDPPRPISEEARRIGGEDKELRAAIRDAFLDPARREEFAKQRGRTPEQFSEKFVDGCVEAGFGEAFRLYRTKHGRYPNETEVIEVAWMVVEGDGGAA